MISDTNVGGNIATISEVSDDQKTTIFHTRIQTVSACLELDQNYTIAEASRSLDVGENALRRWVKQLSEERGGVITPKCQSTDAGAAADTGIGSPL